ncbi:TPA: hypothetical protein ACH3X1_004205 [Trebouxia sp. C0004]
MHTQRHMPTVFSASCQIHAMHAPLQPSLSQHKQSWIARSFDSIRLQKRSVTRSKACRSKCSSTQTTVDRELPKQKHPGLVLTTGPSEAWDHAAVGNPVVRCYFGDNEQRWYMWYSGNSSSGRAVDAISPCSGATGVATSSNGADWTRVPSASSAAPSATAAEDKKKSGPKGQGCVMQPGEDWWTFDTCHIAVSDVQILSNNAVATGVGVYWMFYSGASFEDVAAPEGFPGLQAHDSVEGLRYASNKIRNLNSLNEIRQKNSFPKSPLPSESLR